MWAGASTICGLPVFVDGSAEALRIPRLSHEGEVECGVHFVGLEVGGESLGIVEPDLADQYARRVKGVSDPTPRAVDVVDRRGR